MISCCGDIILICTFLRISDVEHLFMCLTCVCLLWRNVYLDLLPVKKSDYLLCCLVSLESILCLDFHTFCFSLVLEAVNTQSFNLLLQWRNSNSVVSFLYRNWNTFYK